MCNFLSVVILKNGHVLHHPMLDSHSDLVAYFDLPDDTAFIERFAKAELTPVDWLDPSTWQWRIDEAMRPQWLDDVEAKAEAATRAIAKKMILTDETNIPRLIADGCWIVGKKGVVRDVRGGRILRVQDSATIRDVGGSATIRGVGDSATIRDVGGSATIRGVWGSATISGVGGSATIRGVWDSATIRDVGGSATIRGVGGSATLDDSAKAHLVKV